MNVTFMIGNGFDLRLGLYTRFSDMYKGYVDTPSSESLIRNFKYSLHKDAPTYNTWADFEMGMARYAKNLSTEAEMITCIRDFKRYMQSYLKNEQNKFFESIDPDGRGKAIAACAKEMDRSLEGFYKGLIPNIVNSIDKRGKNGVGFQFIVFNYTETLDRLLEIRREYHQLGNTDEVIHIHGSLSKNDVVLGVDNLNQLSDVSYHVSSKLERAFIKPLFNSQYDLMRLERAQELIQSSDLICAYGMSFGASDMMWRNLVKEWLEKDDAHQLVYYFYKDLDVADWTRDELMDEEDVRKQEFMEKLEINEDDQQMRRLQIHIPVGTDIFNFKHEISTAIRVKRIIENSLSMPLP